MSVPQKWKYEVPQKWKKVSIWYEVLIDISQEVEKGYFPGKRKQLRFPRKWKRVPKKWEKGIYLVEG